MRSDLAPEDAVGLLAAVDSSADRLLADLTDPNPSLDVGGSTLLPDWDVATVLGHLRYGAVASLAITRAVLAGEAVVPFYPGGPAEREASLRSGKGSTLAELAELLGGAHDELLSVWEALTLSDWDRRFEEPHLGPVRLSRLVALRLTELEVHHHDLGSGYQPSDWNGAFVTACLPLRVAWLARHHRVRADADLDVDGRWGLRVADGPAWVVEAAGAHADSRVARGDEEVDWMVGQSHDLLAMLLGRPSKVEPLHEVGRFKRAFPGP